MITLRSEHWKLIVLICKPKAEPKINTQHGASSSAAGWKGVKRWGRWKRVGRETGNPLLLGEAGCRESLPSARWAYDACCTPSPLQSLLLLLPWCGCCCCFCCMPHCTPTPSMLPGVPCASLSMVIAKLFVLISHAASWLLRLRQVYCTLHHCNHSLSRFQCPSPKYHTEIHQICFTLL